MTRVECPKCGTWLRVPYRGPQQKYRCPGCQCIFRARESYTWMSMGWLRRVWRTRQGRWGVIIAICCIVMPCLLMLAHHLKVSQEEADSRLGSGQRPPVRVGSGRGQGTSSQPSDPAAALYAAASQAVVMIDVQGPDGKTLGTGSGFFVSSDGLLVTNQHVIERAHAARARLYSGEWVRIGSVLTEDDRADLALLRAVASDVPYLELSADSPAIGTKVYALGNPQGLTNTLSEGLISGVRDFPQRGEVLQTTAPVSGGSSGGPLLLADGRVVGVIALIRGGQNLNFAVPSWRVVELLKRPRYDRRLKTPGD